MQNRPPINAWVTIAILIFGLLGLLVVFPMWEGMKKAGEARQQQIQRALEEP